MNAEKWKEGSMFKKNSCRCLLYVSEGTHGRRARARRPYSTFALVELVETASSSPNQKKKT